MKRIIILTVLVLLLSGGLYLYRNLGGMIVQQAERIASEAIGVKVDIGSINVSLADKKVTVRGIAIANPPGFKQPHALTAESIDITLNTANNELIDFKDITVKGSVIELEVNEHGMNVLALKDLANRKEQKQKAANETLKVIIQRMVIDATTVRPSLTLLSRDSEPLHLPPLTFSGIGQGKSVTAGDAIVRILNEYLALVAKQAAGGGLIQKLPGSEDIEKGADDALKSIKGMF